MKKDAGLQSFVSGIQQIGIGVADAAQSFAWFRKAFGMDVPIFDDSGEAPYMTRYTGGTVHSRRAILAASLAGGSALEIWQYTSRTPEGPSFAPALGDLGIFAARIKAPDVRRAYAELLRRGIPLLGAPARSPDGGERFFLSGPSGAIFEVAGGEDWFSADRAVTGGVAGCIIGSSDIDRSVRLYSELLGFTDLLYDESGTFEDLRPLPGGSARVRRVMLRRTLPLLGAFGGLFGRSTVELVQSLDRSPRTLFEDRLWGDLGFIHLCLDVSGIGELLKRCEAAGFRATADSGSSFDMGQAAGRFAYIEDPDGTLIEFVETHRIPIMKKIGLYLNLGRRDARRPLPRWMIKLLALGRVRD